MDHGLRHISRRGRDIQRPEDEIDCVRLIQPAFERAATREYDDEGQRVDHHQSGSDLSEQVAVEACRADPGECRESKRRDDP